MAKKNKFNPIVNLGNYAHPKGKKKAETPKKTEKVDKGGKKDGGDKGKAKGQKPTATKH